MNYILLTVTFIYTLIEKKEFFKKPINLKAWAYGFLLVVATVIAFFIEHSKSLKDEKNESLITSLSADNKNLKTQIDTLRKDNRDYHSATIDILAKNDLAMRVKFDSNTNKLDTEIVRLIGDVKLKNKEIDSLKIKSEGTVLIQPSEYLLKCDTLTNRVSIKLAVCNLGDMVAKNVKIDVIAVDKLNINDKIKIGTWVNSFSAKPDCYEYYVPENVAKVMPDPRKYLFAYNITFVNQKGKIENYTSGIFYKYDLGRWTYLSTDCSKFFKN